MKLNTRSILKTAIWTILAVALGVLCLSAANFKKQAALKGVSVEMIGSEEGQYFMKKETIESEIIKLIGSLDKHTVGDISCDIIERELSRNPFIEDVNVFVSGRGVLTARLKQRSPVVRVISRGESFYIDAEGKRMPTSPYYSPRVHVITGNAAARDAESILDVVRYIRQDAVLDALVSQIELQDKDDIVLIPTVGKVKIRFGAPEYIVEKFENLKAFYSEVMAETTWDEYQSIDLRFRNQIVCKKNPTS